MKTEISNGQEKKKAKEEKIKRGVARAAIVQQLKEWLRSGNTQIYFDALATSREVDESTTFADLIRAA